MTQEEKELYNAANAYAFGLDCGDLNTNRETFVDGAKWQKEQMNKIENYQEEGWYSSGDDEYICGISFDEPIKLPVDFYYKKKEE